jgi:hypothetical protein
MKVMRHADSHLSNETLMLFAEGEIGGREEAKIREHLAACWSCRLRIRELDEAIAEFARMYRDAHQQLPPPEGPRALLKARLNELAMTRRASRKFAWFRDTKVMGSAVCFTAVLVILIVVWMAVDPGERKAIPRSDLTPGAVRNLAASDVCRAALSDNAEVMPAVQKQVFAEYGMPNAEARGYEVDYLITPALGGSDDIRNLWPQPYSGSAWNAYVKDALEDRLRRMVCTGQLDLATAQQEIAVNWIAAYKKYFRTNRPLPAHQRFRREESRE